MKLEQMLFISTFLFTLGMWCHSTLVNTVVVQFEAIFQSLFLMSMIALGSFIFIHVAILHRWHV